MMEGIWSVIIVILGGIFIGLGHRWYRRRIAARLADKILSDVVRAKDAFRR